MHVSLLHPKYLSPFWQHKNETKGDIYEIKVEEVEVDTRSVGKPSSPHVDSPGDSQCVQSSIGDAQTQPTVDQCDPPYTQISAIDTQTKR